MTYLRKNSKKIILLFIIFLNLFYYACTTNDKINSKIGLNIKFRLGTQWNRIGKRMNKQDLKENNTKSFFFVDDKIINDLVLIYSLKKRKFFDK